jgi:DNA-binding MarR family transcriptional regulator
VRTTSVQRRDAELLWRAATALASRARAQRAGDLTLNQVAVLGRVAVLGPITPREVAGQMRMSPQALTRPLAALEHRGLVRRTPDPSDGRGALLQITAQGRTALRAEMAPRTRWLAEVVAGHCTDAERRTLVEAAGIMQRLAAVGGGVAPVEP